MGTDCGIGTGQDGARTFHVSSAKKIEFLPSILFNCDVPEFVEVETTYNVDGYDFTEDGGLSVGFKEQIIADGFAISLPNGVQSKISERFTFQIDANVLVEGYTFSVKECIIKSLMSGIDTEYNIVVGNFIRVSFVDFQFVGEAAVAQHSVNCKVALTQK